MVKSPGSSAAVAVLSGYGSIAAWQEAAYRTFHQHPELGNQEVKTAAAAADALREAGYEVHEQVGTTGVVGVLRNGDGPVVLMRADMDALPMKEETGLPYASVDRQADPNGDMVPVAHACGHDVHVASLMAAARLLAASPSHWHGTFVALFQPAEELATGAAGMVKAELAALIPKPDVALAQHRPGLSGGPGGYPRGPIPVDGRQHADHGSRTRQPRLDASAFRRSRRVGGDDRRAPSGDRRPRGRARTNLPS